MISTDILIVGAGPAGLATAISLKRRGYAGRVVVLDKGRSPGSHVLSGAVIDPSGFKGLLTDDEIAKLPVEAHVNRESFRFILGANSSVKIPWVPPMMQAHGYPVGSLTKVVQYLTKIALGLGAEVYTGYAVTELVEEDGVVVGARTGEKGVDLDGRPKSNHLPSEEIRANLTVLAEGGAGILTDRLIEAKGLAGRRPQSYALGIKELIELPAPVEGSGGTIMHTFGYPVDMKTYGGGFVYHVSDSQVMVGYALGLDYRDPTIDPHELFRRYKATKAVREHIAGGKAVAYGAKMIPEGGYYAMPKVHAPGVLIVGDGAGLLDGLRIKGIHIALQSGAAAAEAIVEKVEEWKGGKVEEWKGGKVEEWKGGKVEEWKGGKVEEWKGGKVEEWSIGAAYERLLRETSGYREVRRVKNVHGGFTYGAPFGVAMAGLAWATFGALPFWMFGRREKDAETLSQVKVKGQGQQRNVANSAVQPSTFNLQPSSALFPDRLTDVFMSGTVHEENQPCHLKIRDAAKCAECEARYGSPCTRFCPAEVYRLDVDSAVQPSTSNLQPSHLRIDFSNCLHCKTCKVKCPYENVDWTFPQGGDGPRYTRM